MTVPKTVVVNRNDLEEAFEFVSVGAPSENSATISLATGKIRWHSTSIDVEDDDEPDEAEEAEGYISVPHKNDLGLGRSLVLRFVDQEMPRDYDAVTDFFRRRGAYGRFKNLLQTRRMLERWYEFEEHATNEALLVWCEENGIRAVDKPSGTGC
jgi:hypothetical protein